MRLLLILVTGSPRLVSSLKCLVVLCYGRLGNRIFARSTAVSELIAFYEASDELLWLSSFLKELLVAVPFPVKIY